MEKVQTPEWITYHGQCTSAGKRDVLLIINQTAGSVAPESVPQCKIDITEENRRRLTNQGIPPECSDDLSILRARYSLDRKKTLVGVEINKPGSNLTRSYVLRKIQEFFERTEKPGCVIYYSGHGKRNTGDWCFKDGFITFEDVIALYISYFRGRVLTIITDCSYSGNWVKACFRYLDEQGVQPCGHSAVEKGTLLKVFASCKPQEVAATPCFSVRCASNDKNTGEVLYCLHEKLRETQHAYGVDFTRIRCKKAFNESCALLPDYTWHKWNESERIFLVRGNDRDRPAWHYVLLIDDEETIKIFKEKTQGEVAGTQTVNLSSYGQVIKSGWGKEPPNEVKDWIDKNYTCGIND